MARKLPWTAKAAPDPDKLQTRHVASTVPKKEKVEAGGRPTTPEPTQQRSHKRLRSRSPSTSPIRPPAQPVPNIEAMFEGHHADDRYIMVEDEFEAVAKQFTAHLHAAEYARLKRKAKEAPHRAIPDLSPSMPQRTKLSLERKNLLSRQSTTLSGFNKRAKAAAGRGSGSEDDSSDREEVDDKVVDPWSGTSLATLMGEGRQSKMSLVGLDRVNSGTRAARGFGRGETESTPKKKKKTIMDIFGEAGRREGEIENEDELEVDLPFSRPVKTRNIPTAAEMKNTSSSPAFTKKTHDNKDNRNHGIVSRRVEKESEYSSGSHRKPEPSITHPHPRLSSSPPPPQQRHPHVRPTARPKPKHIFIDDLDDFDVDQPTGTTTLVSPSHPPPLPSSSSRTKPSPPTDGHSKADAKKNRRSRLDEVPVFLV